MADSAFRSIEEMDIEELKQLQQAVRKAIASFESRREVEERRRKAEARRHLHARAKELGFSLSQLIEDHAKPTRNGRASHESS